MNLRVEKINNNKYISTMSDGDLAVICSWPGREDYTGKIVMRHNQELIIVGAPGGKSFHGFFNMEHRPVWVEFLGPGTVIKICD